MANDDRYISIEQLQAFLDMRMKTVLKQLTAAQKDNSLANEAFWRGAKQNLNLIKDDLDFALLSGAMTIKMETSLDEKKTHKQKTNEQKVQPAGKQNPS